jgi:gliding motility-associated-like protein
MYKIMMRIFLLALSVLFAISLNAQQCTTLGQTPSTAFPVCGTGSFFKESVPICATTSLFVPGCTSSPSTNYENKNPFWYKFTCYTSGTLSFTITPNTASDDYDWQLYDITGLDPNQVLTNTNIIVTGNWSGSSGPTGASANGVNFVQCASSPNQNAPTFARSPQITAGREYILLVSHFTDSQSGYSLNFGGGTAVITDPLDPLLLRASAPCDGSEIRVKTNKRMKCGSLATDGSDFVVVSPGGTVLIPVSANSFQCSAGFDFDSIALFMNGPLPPGTYTLRAKNGVDGNTLRDNCDRNIPVGDSVRFTVFPLIPTPMDSITKPKCAPNTLQIVFPKKMKCNSIAPDGSDFFITGPYPVNILSATGDCVNGETATITLLLDDSLQVAGNFFLNLQIGADGNTLINECGVETLLPDNAAFVVKDTVNANFGFSINYSCTANIINYTHNGANTVNNWQWVFEGQPNSNLQNPAITYTNFNPTTNTSLIVSNGVCVDTAQQQIVFDNYLNAAFTGPNFVCPEKTAAFVNATVGSTTGFNWQFGNGLSSAAATPFPQSYVPLAASDYDATVRLIATNSYGCSDTATKAIKVVNTCFIAVPNAFTPNGDGKNDFLYPLKAFLSRDLRFSVYNRFGQRVFFSTDWQQKWDGRYKGIPQDSGTFVWTLEYFSLEKNKQIFEKGTTILIR